MNIEKARTNLLLADNLADFMKYLDEAVALKMLICEPKGDPLDVERFNELHAEYEKLDIERLEDYKDSKAFLGVSAQNLITLLDRLVKDLYMDEKIPYNDKNDQLLSCLEYFQLRSRSYLFDSKLMFPSSVLFTVRVRKMEHPLQISLEYLNLNQAQKDELKVLLQKQHEFFDALAAVADITITRLRINKFVFSNYKYEGPDGEMVIGEFLGALVLGKGGRVKGTEKEIDTLFNHLLNIFGLPDQRFSVVLDRIRNNKDRSRHLTKLLDNLKLA